MTWRIILILAVVALSQWIAELNRRWRRARTLPADADDVTRALRSGVVVVAVWLALGTLRWALLVLALLMALGIIAVISTLGVSWL